MTHHHHRSPRQNPQIDSSQEVAVMPRHRSPGLRPLIDTSEDVLGTTHRVRRRRDKSPAAAESLPFNDDMLREIFLRLPPQPSSLLRASAVCKHWRSLVTDPRFLRRVRAHQGKPPLLGVFVTRDNGDIKFRSTLRPPDRIPPERFDLRRQPCNRRSTDLLGCRHGRVLHFDIKRRKVIVSDPVTGEHHRIDAPPVFRGSHIHGAVLCAATDQDHVHGSCHSSPFKVVLMCLCLGKKSEPAACVYSSETGVWGDSFLAADRCGLYDSNPGILIGNILYWSSLSVSADKYILDLNEFTDDIIEFDLDRQSLAVIKGPPCLNGSLIHQIIQTEDGVVGLLIFLHGRFEVWHRKVNCHGGTTWLLQNTFQVHTLLGLPPRTEWSAREMEILGYDEDNGAIFLLMGPCVYMIELLSMQFRKLDGSLHASKCHPFTSFYAPGWQTCSPIAFLYLHSSEVPNQMSNVVIPGGCNGVEMLHDT